jgi:hypothetical protein
MEAAMRANILLVTLFVLVLSVSAAFAQAAAESVLLNGNSATAAAKAGTVLDNTWNKISNKTARQIQTVPQAKVVTHTSKRGTPSASHLPAPAIANRASMITSVQGGRLTRSSATPTPPSPN